MEQPNHKKQLARETEVGHSTERSMNTGQTQTQVTDKDKRAHRT